MTGSEMTALLAVRSLAIEFRTGDGIVAAVKDVTFDIERGEISALVGESGCGKSATALAILRLIPDPPGRITGGEILFDGRDVLKIAENEMRALRGDRIAMIFQEPMTSLNPVHRIGRQVAEPLALHKKIGAVAAFERSIDLLASVNIADPRRRAAAYPHQFSGGMRQRVMIAMAMGCAPDLIIADEPTTALDVTIQAQLLDLLSAQVRQHHTALLLITHNLGIVARYADRVHVMYAGRIVEFGIGRRTVCAAPASLHDRFAALGAAARSTDRGEARADRRPAARPAARAARLSLPSALSLRARRLPCWGAADASGRRRPQHRLHP